MKLSILYFCIIIIIGFASCNEEEKETSITTFSIDTYCEVMLGDTLNIPIVNGSGELDILKSNDEFAEITYKKKNNNNIIGTISVIGRSLGTSSFMVADTVTNNIYTVSYKVIPPWIGLYFKDWLEEWQPIGIGGMEFILVADESCTCYAISRPALGTQLDPKLIMTGVYHITKDGTGIDLDLSGSEYDFNYKFLITKGNVSLLKKVPDIADENPYFEGIIMKELSSGNDLHGLLVYKEGTLPYHIVK